MSRATIAAIIAPNMSAGKATAAAAQAAQALGQAAPAAQEK